MGRYPRCRIERGEAPGLMSRTGRRDGDAEPGAASDLARAELIDERKK